MVIRHEIKHMLEHITDKEVMDNLLKRLTYGGIIEIWLLLPFCSEEAQQRWVDGYNRVFNGGEKNG